MSEWLNFVCALDQKTIMISSPGKLDRKKATLANKYAQAGNNFNRR